MEIVELKTEMDQLFQQVDKRFGEIDKRFEQVDRRFEQVDRRFEQVDRRFEQVDKRFEQVDQQFVELRQHITAEGEKTRRHFDVVAEQMKSERNLVLDQSMTVAEQVVQLNVSNAAAHTTFEQRLDDHERRITEIEQQ